MSSLACSLGVLVINQDSGSSGKRMLVSNILYYLYVNGVVLSAGFVFQWFYISSLPMMAGMIALIAVVFICVKVIFYLRDKALAARIMERLKEECKSE